MTSSNGFFNNGGEGYVEYKIIAEVDIVELEKHFVSEMPLLVVKMPSQDIIENDIHYNIQIYKNKNYSGKFFIDEIIWDLF